MRVAALRLTGRGRRSSLSSSACLSPALRVRLGALALLALLLAGVYLLWFRDSSLVRVQRVSIVGVTASDGPRLRRALTNAARAMTTLHVREERLEKVAKAYAVVRSVDATPKFPHGLRIRVVEHRPVAMAVWGARRAPVAADGTVLRGLPVRAALPFVRVGGAPAGERVAGRQALSLVRLLGAAPRALTPRLRDVRRSPERGIVVRVTRGPELVFGSSKRAPAKWAAAARVLADPAARGAAYLDLRLPDRPAAGPPGARAVGFDPSRRAGPAPCRRCARALAARARRPRPPLDGSAQLSTAT